MPVMDMREAAPFSMTNEAIFARQDLAHSMRQRGMSIEYIMREIGYKSTTSVYRAINAGAERALANENRVSQRMFGVEIEFNRTSQRAAREGIRRIDEEIQVSIEGYNHRVQRYWKLITDSSVRGTGTGNARFGCDGCSDEHENDRENEDCYCDCHEEYSDGCGLEIVSPIMKGREGFRELENVMKGIRRAGGGVDRSCGLHVHHDARDMNAEQLAYLLDFYISHQTLIDSMLAPSRRSTDRGNQWCRPYDDREKAEIVGYAKQGRLRDIHYDRYKTVNITSYAKYGSIEFRQHQGTLNYSKLSAWIRFGQSLMEASVKNGTEGAEVPKFETLEEMLDHLVEDGNLPTSTRKYLVARAKSYSA